MPRERVGRRLLGCPASTCPNDGTTAQLGRVCAQTYPTYKRRFFDAGFTALELCELRIDGSPAAGNWHFGCAPTCVSAGPKGGACNASSVSYCAGGGGRFGTAQQQARAVFSAVRGQTPAIGCYAAAKPA